MVSGRAETKMSIHLLCIEKFPTVAGAMSTVYNAPHSALPKYEEKE